MTLRQVAWSSVRSCVAFVLGVAMLPLVNVAGGRLGDATGFPSGGDQRLAWDLAWVFLAGVVASGVVVLLAPGWRRLHAAGLFVLMLVICVQAVRTLGSDWPGWFSAGLLACLPLQVWLGAAWGLRLRRSRSGGS